MGFFLFIEKFFKDFGNVVLRFCSQFSYIPYFYSSQNIKRGNAISKKYNQREFKNRILIKEQLINQITTMKKNPLAILGIIIQAIALGFMIYGIMHNTAILWIAFPFVFIGLTIAIFAAMKKFQD